MNKRQKKKLDKKLSFAIRELNNDVAISEGFPLITDEQVQKVLIKVKNSKGGISRTLKDYRHYIKH
jgi:hypothetical protein